MARLHVAIRVDAGGRIGVGHAMRCATLAAALISAGHRVTVISASLPTWVAERYRSAGAVIASGPAPPVDVWVVDGYDLGDELTRLAASGVAVVAIDDNHELPVAAARLVVNQNLHASADLYPDVGPDVPLLIGPTYAMIRSDVTSIDRSLHRGRGRTVLVSFGGTDPARLTLPVVTALVAAPDIAVVVALTVENPQRPALEELAERHPGRIWFDAGDLREGFRIADVAAIGGGSTLWEVALLGIPSVAAVIAENQLAGTAAAHEAGFVIGVDARSDDRGAAAVAEVVLSLLDDPERRAAMEQVGRSTFDGRGAERVVAAIESLR